MTSTGRLSVVGLGPGDETWRTKAVIEILSKATDIVGYKPYIVQAGPFGSHQRLHPFPNRKESDRARLAIELAQQGGDVVVVSSGDPGIFAMASCVVEEYEKLQGSEPLHIELEILPGVSAALAASAKVGAPLGHDCCLISLSDVLKPWDVITRRIEAALIGDFVISLYNPSSNHRKWQLEAAFELIAKYRSESTPVIVAKHIGRQKESVETLTLGKIATIEVDMSTILIVGSSATKSFADQMGKVWTYTPRSYTTNDLSNESGDKAI